MYTYVHGYNTGMCTHIYMQTYMYRHKCVHTNTHQCIHTHVYTKSWTHEKYTITSIWTYIQTNTCIYLLCGMPYKIIINLAYFNISQSDKVKSALPNVYQRLEKRKTREKNTPLSTLGTFYKHQMHV